MPISSDARALEFFRRGGGGGDAAASTGTFSIRLRGASPSKIDEHARARAVSNSRDEVTAGIAIPVAAVRILPDPPDPLAVRVAAV